MATTLAPAARPGRGPGGPDRARTRRGAAARDAALSAALADLEVEAQHDPVLHTTVLSWTHRPHPAAVAQVDDAVRAAAAACVVEELLLDVQAG